MFKKFRALAFVVIGLLLSVPALAMGVQSEGLALNSTAFIEFTEENQAPLTLDIIENTVTAVTLAQNRTMDSDNDNRTQIVSTFDSVAKLPQSCKFEVGWQNLNTDN